MHISETDLLLLPRLFPNLQELRLPEVLELYLGWFDRRKLLLSVINQLSNLKTIFLPPQQEILPPWCKHITRLQCDIGLTLLDTELTFEFRPARPASSLQNLAHLQLSYPKDLVKGLPALRNFSHLQSLNIQAGILQARPKLKEHILNVVTLDCPAEAIQTSAFSVLSLLTQLTSLRLIGLAGDFGQATAAQLSSLKQLQHLAIYVESSTGIASLSALTSLTYLCLKGQAVHVSDDAFNSMGRLQQLKVLVLEGSVMAKGMQAAPKLHDRLSGLAGLPHLRTLQFWGWLDEESVAHLSALQHLTRLTLWECVGVTSDSVNSIAKLDQLEYLDLSYNTLAGAEWHPLGALTALTALHLHGCQQVTDATVQGLLTLTNLQWFDISHGFMKRGFYKDQITAKGIGMIGEMTSLRDLNLTDLTRLTDCAVLGLSKLTQLTQICLVGAHNFRHPTENAGLLAMTSLLSLDLSRSLPIDDMEKPDFQPLFAALTNLKQLRYGADDFAYKLASDEPEPVEIYPTDQQQLQNEYGRLHMLV